jgi:hypothetical protein
MICCWAGGVLSQSSCVTQTTHEADREAIRGFYEDQRAAHFERDAAKFLAAVDTGYWSIANGAARFVRKEDALKSVAAYFSVTTFDDVRDVSPPRVSLSADGTTAWLVGEVEVRASQRDSTGSEHPLAFRAAWMDLYERDSGGWHLRVRANTEGAAPASQPDG